MQLSLILAQSLWLWSFLSIPIWYLLKLAGLRGSGKDSEFPVSQTIQVQVSLQSTSPLARLNLEPSLGRSLSPFPAGNILLSINSMLMLFWTILLSKASTVTLMTWAHL